MAVYKLSIGGIISARPLPEAVAAAVAAELAADGVDDVYPVFHSWGNDGVGREIAYGRRIECAFGVTQDNRRTA